MSVFTNEATIQGNINKMHYHDGGEYAVLFLTIGVKSDYKKGNTPKFESVNAQINIKLDKDGKPYSGNSHPKSKMNLNVFNYLNSHAVKGMAVQLKGNIRGTEQGYISKIGQWKSLNELTDEERNDILVYKNETFLYIEHAQLLERKEHFLERQKEDQQKTKATKYVPKDQEEADYLPGDDEEGIEVIVEYSDHNSTSNTHYPERSFEEGEATRIDRKNNSKEAIRSYVPFEETVYSESVPDFSEPDLKVYR